MTRSILVSKIYEMVNGFDIRFIIKQTFATIYKRIDSPKIPLILCIDFYLLYQCLVQLGTTSKKRLMIDIMALKQSYEGREIDDIRWICSKDNSADTMTKTSPNSSLEGLISTNKGTFRLEG